MVLIILATLLILAIAYFQVVQGLFSALIMMILTIICAALALNTYEALAEAFLYSRQGAYADPIALTALFILPLLVLRIVVDRFITGNLAFGPWADRIGGGMIGLVTGMVLVGMLLIIMQMLPFGETTLGYKPYDDALQRKQGVWPFYPDEFTVWLTQGVSGGSLSAEASFEKLHDDLLLECFCARNTAGRNGGVHAAPDALAGRVAAYEPPAEAYEPPSEHADWLAKVPEGPRAREGEPIEEAAPTKVIILEVSVDKSAADADNWFRLPGTHFRLVAKRPEKPTKKRRQGEDADEEADEERGDDTAPAGPTSYYPLGVLDPNEAGTGWTLAKDGQIPPGRLIVERRVTPAGSGPIRWAYRIAKGQRPEYLVFRRVSRREIRTVRKGVPKTPAAPAKTPAPKGGAKKPPTRKKRT